MTTPVYSPADDLIDRIVGIQAGDALHAVRHQRDKVAVATQGSYDALFDPALAGVSLTDRLLVALYACALTPAPELAEHYRTRLNEQGADASLIAAVENDKIDGVPDTALRTILAFTRTLILDPVKGDKAALETLPAAGVSTPDVVAIAQLIAFLSYQVRLVASLKAMAAARAQGVAA